MRSGAALRSLTASRPTAAEPGDERWRVELLVHGVARAGVCQLKGEMRGRWGDCRRTGPARSARG